MYTVAYVRTACSSYLRFTRDCLRYCCSSLTRPQERCCTARRKLGGGHAASAVPQKRGEGIEGGGYFLSVAPRPHLPRAHRQSDIVASRVSPPSPPPPWRTTILYRLDTTLLPNVSFLCVCGRRSRERREPGRRSSVCSCCFRYVVNVRAPNRCYLDSAAASDSHINVKSFFAHSPRLFVSFTQAQLAPKAGGLGGKSYVLTCGEGDFPSRRLRQIAASFQVRGSCAQNTHTRRQLQMERRCMFLEGGRSGRKKQISSSKANCRCKLQISSRSKKQYKKKLSSC